MTGPVDGRLPLNSWVYWHEMGSNPGIAEWQNLGPFTSTNHQSWCHCSILHYHDLLSLDIVKLQAYLWPLVDLNSIENQALTGAMLQLGQEAVAVTLVVRLGVGRVLCSIGKDTMRGIIKPRTFVH